MRGSVNSQQQENNTRGVRERATDGIV